MILNANENSVINLGYMDAYKDEILKNLNRYPDSDQTKLRVELADYLNLEADNVLVGCGSDQLIDLCCTAYLKNDSLAIVPDPSFSMYGFYVNNKRAKIESIELIEGKYNKDDYIKKLQENKADLVFICNPNNPTGCVMSNSDIEEILKVSKVPVVVDEAYHEFYGETVIDLVNRYDNLIVLRTFSKAFGLAAIRLGYMAASKSTVDYIKERLQIYNVSSLSLDIAGIALKNVSEMKKSVLQIKENREYLFNQLKSLGLKVYESKANFIFFNTVDDKKVFDELVSKDITIRYFSFGLRVTVGNREETERFLLELKNILKGCEEVG